MAFAAASASTVAETMGGLFSANKFIGRGLFGAAAGIGLAGAGTVAHQFFPNNISSNGIMQGGLSGALYATGAYGAWAGAKKLAGATEGMFVRPWMTRYGRYASGGFGKFAIGAVAGALGVKSIINTSLTQKV